MSLVLGCEPGLRHSKPGREIMMDVGIFTWTNAAIDPALLAKRAEELGFESFWVPELPIIPVEADRDFPTDTISGVDASAVTDPFVALSRASAVTTRIKIGTGVCLVPEHNPFHLAKKVASLDQFSRGRSSSASAPEGSESSRRSWGPISTTAGLRLETRCWR